MDTRQTHKALKLLTSLAVSDQVPYILKDGIISYNGRMWLGHSSEIQSRVISALHASALGGHSGFLVTYARIKQLFYWPHMSNRSATLSLPVSFVTKQNRIGHAIQACCNHRQCPVMLGKPFPLISSKGYHPQAIITPSWWSSIVSANMVISFHYGIPSLPSLWLRHLWLQSIAYMVCQSPSFQIVIVFSRAPCGVSCFDCLALSF